MHSAIFHQPFILLRTRGFVIAMITISIAGCRSGQPLNSMVQVTEDPTAVVSNLPAPEQRLATASTRKQTSPKQTPNKQTDLASAVASNLKTLETDRNVSKPTVTTTDDLRLSDDPKVTQARAASTKPPVELDSKLATTQATAKTQETTPAADRGDHDTGDTDGGIKMTVGGLVSASLTDLSDPKNDDSPTDPKPTTSPSEVAPSKTSSTGSDGLVQSKAGDRPNINRRPVRETNSPNTLDQALAAKLDQLPKLPTARQAYSGPAPKRIGSADTRIARSNPTTPSESSESVSDLPPVDDLPADDLAPLKVGAEELVADSTPKVDPPTSATATVSDQDEPAVIMNANQILPVSHAGDESKIGMAKHELPSSTDALPTKPSPQATGEQEPAKQTMTEQELYTQLLGRLAEPRSGESPAERDRRQIILRHLMVLSGQPNEAVDAIDGLNPTEQLFLKNQLMGLWTMIDPDGHPSSGRRITEALPKYREATRHMAAATDSLALKNLEFCTEIESYGQIKPFEGNRFASGQQVILYCEIENFAAADHDGQFQTQLQGSYDIYDASGTKVISQLLPVDKQRSRNRLRDYFVAYQMSLPKGLPTGTYRLQLTIEDMVGKKYGQSNIPFEIR